MGRLFIALADNAVLKEGQTAFISYNGGGDLQDHKGTQIRSFGQIVSNNSSIYNDIQAPMVDGTSINSDGQSITLNFS